MIRFFVCNDIISLIDDKIEEINNLINTISQENTKPFFIYTYSIFESTITEILRYYLKAFPEKIDKINSISKDDLLYSTMVSDLIIKNINTYIRCYSNDTLYNYLTFFNKILSIDTELDINKINNISTIRNAIVHDGSKFKLLTKHIYNIPKEEFNASAAHESMLFLMNYLVECQIQIKNKYKNYTLEKLLRNIWGNVFSSSLLSFDNIWEIDERGTLRIKSLEHIKLTIQGISNTEHLLLSVFFQQYNKDLNPYFRTFQDLPALVSLDSDSKDKLVQIISFFKSYPFLFNGEIIK